MYKYWYVFKLTLNDILAYRVDNLIRAMRYALVISFMLLVWLAISRETAISQIDPTHIVQYFVVATVLFSFSNYHLDYLEQDIRLGYISKFLLKPISPFWYYCIHQGTYALFDACIKILVFIPIVVYFGYTWPITVLTLGWFMLFSLAIFLTTFSLFFMMSTLAFWIQTVESLRMCILFTGRFLSGILIPFFFFPEPLQKILWWLPFPHFAYTPIETIIGHLSLLPTLQGFSILICWAIVATIGRRLIWHQATHSYESTGI